jgi:hypothetical protein
VAKYNANTGTRTYWVYFGGSSADTGRGIAVDSIGNAYITGYTSSNNLPTLNANQPALAGGTDAFAVKLNVAGGVVYATYLGGTSEDYGIAVAVHNGSAYVAGVTNSGNFPLQSSIKGVDANPSDAFVTQFAPNGALLYSTRVGGSGSEFTGVADNLIAPGITVDSAGSVYIAGVTYSSNVPSSISGNVLQGGQDGFIAKLASAETSFSNRFFPVTPCRIADTRDAARGPLFGAPLLTTGVPRNFPIPASPCGIPANATAYALNVAVLPVTQLGHLTMWPTGQPVPLVSTLNAWDGSTVANAAIVPAGSNGSISAYASNDTHMIIDINGYFAPDSGGGYDFVPTDPCRIADSRDATRPGTLGVPHLSAGSQRSYPVPSSGCPVPPNAVAYVMNATVVPREPLGHMTLWPTGQTIPLVSTLNAWDANTIANTAIVPAGTNGAINAYVSNSTDVILDISGYFPAVPGTGFGFRPLPPCRIVDTRQPATPASLGAPSLSAGEVRDFPVTASSCGIPIAAAYSINVTAVPKEPLGHMTIWPTGQAMPLASILNARDGNVVANGTIVRAGLNGYISVYATNATDVLIDVNGYFAP